MRSRGRKTAGDADRGVSELAGYVLLIGIVIAGAMAIFVIATPLMTDSQDHQEDETSEFAMEEVDSRLTSLAASGGSAATEFRLLENEQQTHNEPELVTDRGYINVTINRNSTCSVNTSLDSIRVETETGDTLVYEAGGVWRQSSEGGVAGVTPPAVSIQDGHVDIALANLTGGVSGGSTEALLNATTSNNASRNAIQTLYQGDCKRPDNVTIEIKSDVYEGWADHLGDTGGYTNLTVDGTNGTTTAFLDQSALPPETNDAVNNVVNLTNASYMSNVTVSRSGIAVSKNASNNYTVYVEPVADDIEIGTMRNVSASDNVTRDPLDVVFVVDESGSMRWNANPDKPGCHAGTYNSGCERKIWAVQDAIQNFTTYLDSDLDRVGLVGFNEDHPNRGKAYRTNEWSLTSDFVTFNDTTSGTLGKLQATGGTYSAGGMKEAAALLDLRSNETRDKVIVMLSDGQNDHRYEEWWVAGDTFKSGQTYAPNIETYAGTYESGTNAATVQLAKLANKTGVTTYTVGFGASVLPSRGREPSGPTAPAVTEAPQSTMSSSGSDSVSTTASRRSKPRSATVRDDGANRRPASVDSPFAITFRRINISIGVFIYYLLLLLF